MVKMSKFAVLLAATSAWGTQFLSFELAFVDKQVALFESQGRAVQHGGDTFLQGLWRVPYAWCEVTMHKRAQGWNNSSHVCYGYKRAPGATLRSTNSGQFAALPVFPRRDWAEAFSGMGQCVGAKGQYVPFGVVTQMVTSGNVTMFTHHAV